MTEEIKKRLEEAARNYAETVVVIQSDLREEYIKESMLDFKTGASFGYKEAIAMVKEYLEKRLCDAKSVYEMSHHEDYVGGFMDAINEIINELFKQD